MPIMSASGDGHQRNKIRKNLYYNTATGSARNGCFEFKDAVQQDNEYAYDANDNLTKDLNKGIAGISYNCLNLPGAVTFIDGNRITYTYAADGTKLRTVHGIGGASTTTDYCTNVIYENGTAKFLLTEKGYVSLNHALGYNGLADDEAHSSYLKSYTSLKDRPDYDGYLTLAEANKWYREGKGQPLFTSLAKMDLSGIYSLGEKYVGKIKSFNLLLHSGSLNDGLVYGNVTLKRYPNHSVRAFSDKYDFEMHNGRNPLNWGRNIETIIGNRVAGKGRPYEINIYGSTKLTPFLPWIK